MPVCSKLHLTPPTEFPRHPAIHEFVRIQPLANRGIHTRRLLRAQAISRFPRNALFERLICQRVDDGLYHHLLSQGQGELLHVAESGGRCHEGIVARGGEVVIGGGEGGKVVTCEVFGVLGFILRSARPKWHGDIYVSVRESQMKVKDGVLPAESRALVLLLVFLVASAGGRGAEQRRRNRLSVVCAWCVLLSKQTKDNKLP